MYNLRIWDVKFGNYTREEVVASNIKNAIKRAMTLRKRNGDTYMNRIQDVTDVALLHEAQVDINQIRIAK